MSIDSNHLRRDALRIWQAGLEAVRSQRLVKDALRVEGSVLVVGEERLRLDGIRRIAVVGAGKAGAGMAAVVEEILGPRLMEEKQLVGWVNVPADCCCRAGILPARKHAHAAEEAVAPAGETLHYNTSRQDACTTESADHAARRAAGGRQRTYARGRGRRGRNPAAGRIARAGRSLPVSDLRRRLGPDARAG